MTLWSVTDKCVIESHFVFNCFSDRAPEQHRFTSIGKNMATNRLARLRSRQNTFIFWKNSVRGFF